MSRSHGVARVIQLRWTAAVLRHDAPWLRQTKWRCPVENYSRMFCIRGIGSWKGESVCDLIYVTFICLLTLSQTCKTLKAILSQPFRQLWLSLLQKLDVYQAPNLPLDVPLNSLSSEELQLIVTRTVLGQRNWESSSPRTVRRRILDLGNTGGLMGNLKPTQPFRDIIRLSPGGNYVGILWSGGYLQIWNTVTRLRIWTYPPLGDFPDFQVEAYDFCSEQPNSSSFAISVAGTLQNMPMGMKWVC